MTNNVLVTGAGGYIGGSIAANFLSSSSPVLQKAHITAAVRSLEHVAAWAKLGVDAVQVDLSDENAVTQTVLQHEVNIVIHTASAMNWNLAKNLITALGKRKETSGQQTYFIHTSGTGAFYPNTGWPAGDFSDTDDVFGTEKRLADSFPIRQTDVNVVDYSKALGVLSYIIVPTITYGKGTGPWNQLSVIFPPYVSAALAHKAVYKFPENTKISGVHISDLTGLYGLVLEAILQGKQIEHGEKGYYFGIAHPLHWHDLAKHLALALKARGLVTSDETRIWSSAEEAAEPLGVPAAFVQALWNSGENIITHNEERIGWKPIWTTEKFYARIDDEIDAVVELGKAKSSLIDSLHAAARG
ncbi:hypothetical protein BKA63DRAFT_605181 [Paraphoma chrysanthemicola]|nr:hypothetical protein BKA63DRAFT_605181 [Paraphoma chrysanthemicola]